MLYGRSMQAAFVDAAALTAHAVRAGAAVILNRTATRPIYG
jgi:hypothetical protein